LIALNACFFTMLSSPKRVAALLILALITISCAKNHRTTIVGDWSGNEVTITKGNETISVPIDKYGYLTLSLNGDSTYIMSLAVLKDVRVEKQVFGMTANKVLIPAVYKSTRYGKWVRADSGCILSSQEGVVSVRPSMDGETLDLKFTDADGRAWQASLEPKE
jgi:hypothetical protein